MSGFPAANTPMAANTRVSRDQDLGADRGEAAGEEGAQRAGVAGGDLGPAPLTRRHARQASTDQISPGTRRLHRRVEQLDRQLASADETAPEDHDTGGVDDHLDVASVAQRSLYSRMVGDDRIEFGRWLRRTSDTTSGQHDVDGADLPVAFGQPVQHIWMEGRAEAVGA